VKQNKLCLLFCFFSLEAPRSSLAWKNFIDVGAGVIDADYRGNVGVVLFNHSTEELKSKSSAGECEVVTKEMNQSWEENKRQRMRPNWSDFFQPTISYTGFFLFISLFTQFFCCPNQLPVVIELHN
jgi:hypothetical protein